LNLFEYLWVKKVVGAGGRIKRSRGSGLVGNLDGKTIY
jgi:hypothetical protein